MNNLISAIKYFYIGIQFIFVVIFPLFICLYIAGFLKDKYNLGDWITLVSILVGLFFMVLDAYSFGKFVLRELEKDGKKKNGK